MKHGMRIDLLNNSAPGTANLMNLISFAFVFFHSHFVVGPPNVAVEQLRGGNFFSTEFTSFYQGLHL